MQIGLFEEFIPRFRELRPQRRIDLGRGAWIERIPQWLGGQAALFERLRHTAAWTAKRRRMYDRMVDVPRLMAPPPRPLEPVLNDAQQRLEHYTGWSLPNLSLALYRDGKDSVAWHGDRMGELRSDCVMGIVSLGAQRRFVIRPAGGGRSRTLELSGGDLVLMGGTIHETFEHAVPKEPWAGPRIAVMFRPHTRPATGAGDSLVALRPIAASPP